MEIVGIICEYNPFHNGHIYHLKKIKELYPDSLIILVLNGYFLERGEISILTKEEIELGENISKEKKETMQEIYNTFGRLTALQLVNFTHAKDSPWAEVWNEKHYSEIPKQKIKKWFERYIKNE